MPDDDGHDYDALAETELALAAVATNMAVKTMHLNAAARYATLSERSPARAPGHGLTGDHATATEAIGVSHTAKAWTT